MSGVERLIKASYYTMSMIPQKLKSGDEIRIISPSRSLAIISSECREIALRRLKELGLKVTYSKHAEEKDEFNSSSIKSRIADIHDAFSDKKVKGILTTIGGFISNQFFRYLGYNLLKSNHKRFRGFFF